MHQGAFLSTLLALALVFSPSLSLSHPLTPSLLLLFPSFLDTLLTPPTHILPSPPLPTSLLLFPTFLPLRSHPDLARTADMDFVVAERDAIAAALDGRDDRLVVLVGPDCVHDRHGAMAYATMLLKAREVRPCLLSLPLSPV